MNKEAYYKLKSNFLLGIIFVLLLLVCAVCYRLSVKEKEARSFKSNYETEIKLIDEDFAAIELEKKQAWEVISKLEKRQDSIIKSAQKERTELLNAAWRIKREYAAKTYGGVVEQPDTNLLCFGETGVDSLNAAAIDFKACKAQSLVKDSTILAKAKIIAQDSAQIALGEQKDKVHTEHVKALQKELGKERRTANFYQGLTAFFGALAAALALK